MTLLAGWQIAACKCFVAKTSDPKRTNRLMQAVMQMKKLDIAKCRKLTNVQLKGIRDQVAEG